MLQCSSISLWSVLPEESHSFWGDKWKGSATSEGLNAHVISEFGRVSLESFSLGTLTSDGRADANDTLMDSAGNAVLLLDIDLGQVESLGVLVSEVVADVSLGGSIEHVSHLESLDGLVLWHDSGAVDAADNVRVALVILRSTVVTSLRWHIFINNQYNCRHPFNATAL